MRKTVKIAILAALATSTGAAALLNAQKVVAPGRLAGLVSVAFGALGADATPVDPAHPLPVDPVVRGGATDRGASVGTTATALMPANAARRGFAVQIQSAAADCYISGQAAATADYHSLKIPAGSYYETPGTHVGTAAISIVCTAAGTPVYAREW